MSDKYDYEISGEIMKNSAIIRRSLCVLLTFLLLIVPVSATEAEIDLSITKGGRTLDGMVPLLNDDEALTDAYSALLYDINSDDTTNIYQVSLLANSRPKFLITEQT